MNPHRNPIFIALICVLFIVPPEKTVAGTQSNHKQIGLEAGSIVVTVKPLYSLVAHITEGIHKPELLIKHSTSPHHYQLRPSDRRLLANANVIIWFGPEMEGYLEKLILQQKTGPTNTKVITALQAENLKLLSKRGKDGSTHLMNESHTYQQKNIDPHIWLSTHNAAAISRHIAQSLKIIDPWNTEQYEENLQQLLNKIERTNNFIKVALATISGIRQKPFITYHDAFQYFEDDYKLNHIDTINYDDEAGTSLKHIGDINTLIENKNIRCLIYQPPKHSIIDVLTKRTAINAIAIDPTGINTKDDENAWFELMQDMAIGFEKCLSY